MSAKGHRWPRCYCGYTWLKHCPFDESGVDHTGSCDKYHHEFKVIPEERLCVQCRRRERSSLSGYRDLCLGCDAKAAAGMRALA